MLVTWHFLFLASVSSVSVYLLCPCTCETRSSHFSFRLHTINTEDQRSTELVTTGKTVVVYMYVQEGDLMHVLGFINSGERLTW